MLGIHTDTSTLHTESSLLWIEPRTFLLWRFSSGWCTMHLSLGVRTPMYMIGWCPWVAETNLLIGFQVQPETKLGQGGYEDHLFGHNVKMKIIFFQVLKQLRHLKFQNNRGEMVRFDESSELSANYTIINWHRSSEDGSVVFREVGYYSSHSKKGAKLSIDKSRILWNGYLTEVSRSVEQIQNVVLPSHHQPQIIFTPKGNILSCTALNNRCSNSKLDKNLRQTCKTSCRFSLSFTLTTVFLFFLILLTARWITHLYFTFRFTSKW